MTGIHIMQEFFTTNLNEWSSPMYNYHIYILLPTNSVINHEIKG